MKYICQIYFMYTFFSGSTNKVYSKYTFFWEVHNYKVYLKLKYTQFRDTSMLRRYEAPIKLQAFMR